jgi:NagD protein
MAKSIISDMDGVIYRGKNLIPGANEFVARIKAGGQPFLFLTNASEYTPAELRLKLEQRGIHGLEDGNFITSSMVTAMFVSNQKPGARVWMVGERGLRVALEEAGCQVANGADPGAPPEGPVDFVVVGKTVGFDFRQMKAASRLIEGGAKFIGTNPDKSDPMDDGNEPACGAVLASIAAATGRRPYVVGKPNALMMTLATRMLRVHPDDAVMIGDRMDTDILGGMEAGMTTVLVLSGATADRSAIEAFPYRPDHVFNSVAEIDPLML